MPNEIDGIVASLRGQEPADVNPAFATVDLWNRESRTGDLLALAAAIEAACDVEGAARFPYEAVADHIEEELVLTAGGDHVDALFTLLARPRVRSVQRERTTEMRVRSIANPRSWPSTRGSLRPTTRSARCR